MQDPQYAAPVDEPLLGPPGPSPGELFQSFVDGSLSRLARRPLRVRMRTSPAAAVRGEIEAAVFELGDVEVTGLRVERLLLHTSRLRFVPGIPPRVMAGPVGMKATMTQDAIDDWTQRARLPVRLVLTPEGVVARTGVGGIQLSEVHTELAVQGPFLSLRPKRATMLGLTTSLVGIFRGYLPLPPLPLGARLARVDVDHARLTTWFDLDDIDEPLTPSIARRLRTRVRPGLPLPF